MTADSSEQSQPENEVKFDKFAEPKAMSVGWDLSNLPSNPGSETSGKILFETQQAGRDQTTNASGREDAAIDPHPDVDFDPFPEPRTVPTKWNVSALR
jgi:hypothetical protein